MMSYASQGDTKECLWISMDPFVSLQFEQLITIVSNPTILLKCMRRIVMCFTHTVSCIQATVAIML